MSVISFSFYNDAKLDSLSLTIVEQDFDFKNFNNEIDCSPLLFDTGVLKKTLHSDSRFWMAELKFCSFNILNI